MYITNVTDNVRKIFDKLEEMNDVGKLKFTLYVFDLMNNNQINNKMKKIQT